MSGRNSLWFGHGFATALAFMVGIAGSPGVLASEAEPIARLTLETREPTFTGGLIRAYVEVLSPVPMYRAPRFPALDIPGTVALQPERSGGSFSERVQGETWFGVRRGYAIYPQRPGHFEIPAVTVVLPGSDGRADRSIETAAAPFEVIAPETDVPGERLIVSPRVTVRQTFRPSEINEGQVEVGAALERRIEVRAEDTLGMLIPPLELEPEFGSQDGLIAYPGQPKVADTGNRGRFTGSRSESMTYLFARPGTVALPDVTVAWWNPQASRLMIETLAGIEIEVTAGSITPTTDRASRSKDPFGGILNWLRHHLMQMTLTLIVGYAAYHLGRRLWTPGWARYRSWRQARANSQSRRWAELHRASRGGDADATVTAFWRWIDRQRPGAGWSQVVSDPELRNAWGAFEQSRYGSQGPPAETSLPIPPSTPPPMLPSRQPRWRTSSRTDDPPLATLNPTKAQSQSDV